MTASQNGSDQAGDLADETVVAPLDATVVAPVDATVVAPVDATVVAHLDDTVAASTSHRGREVAGDGAAPAAAATSAPVYGVRPVPVTPQGDPHSRSEALNAAANDEIAYAGRRQLPSLARRSRRGAIVTLAAFAAASCLSVAGLILLWRWVLGS